jgi:hypothetical protein
MTDPGTPVPRFSCSTCIFSHEDPAYANQHYARTGHKVADSCPLFIPGCTGECRKAFASVRSGCLAGGRNVWWASCHPCSWWNSSGHSGSYVFSPAEAQRFADEHNRVHHPARPLTQ